MTQQLAAIFGEVGISQYLEIFVEQGFDTWEAILDITESDLDALGVKLGHRRKLQRRIANSRGLAPDASLVPPKPPAVEEPKPETQPTKQPVKLEIRDVTPVVVTKRKYRRHPKPDENAPERPPSAYVLFSNKMRDDLRGRNLTFTEIAKLVGEHWRTLSQSDKEPFESRAQAAKDRYNTQLTEYKKTPLYRKYMDYLQEFKAKHAHQSQEKEATKRIKLSSVGAYQTSSNSGTPARTSRSGSGSGSGSGNDDPRTTTEPFSTRHRRFGSVLSTTDSQVSVTPALHHTSLDEIVYSPSSSHHACDRLSLDRSPVVGPVSQEEGPGAGKDAGHRRGSAWHDDYRGDPNSAHRFLPPLSDVFDYRGAINSGSHTGDLQDFPFPRGNYNPDNAGSPPGLVGGEMRPATLRKEQSSAGSISSGSSYSYPRTPIDGPLPIYALLSEKPQQQQQQPQQPQQPQQQQPPPPPPLSSQFYSHPLLAHRQSIDGHAASYGNGSMRVSQESSSAPGPTQQAAHPGRQQQQQHQHQQRGVQQPGVKTQSNLDGMSALLRAGEIVDGRTR